MDIRFAHLASVLANVNRNPEKKPEPWTIADFLLFQPEPEPLSADAVSDKVLAVFSQIAAGQG